jgi:hypothetical protein
VEHIPTTPEDLMTRPVSTYQARRADEAEIAGYARFLSVLAVALLTVVMVEAIRSGFGF